MNITTAIDGNTAKITVEGKLSVTTSPELESAVMGLSESVINFDFDLSGLDYISSAGLRVILKTRKVMSRQGDMVVRNVKPEIYEVFEMTGFLDFLTIE